MLALRRHADKSADRVEHVHEQECEHDDQHVKAEDLACVGAELAEDRLHGRRGVDESMELRESHRDADDGGGDDSDKKRLPGR